MPLSPHALGLAGLLLVLGLAQVYALRGVLERARAGLPAPEAEAKKAMHGTLLKALLAFDVLALPVIGYFVGRAVFG